MPAPKNISQYGNQLKVNYDDGSSKLAYPTMGGTWIIYSTDSPDPPDPGGGNGQFSWPFNPATDVSSEFGPRDGGTRFHEGIDFGYGKAQRGANVLCMNTGTISGATSNSGYGPYITVFHGTIGAYDVYTRYGHIDTYTRWSVGQAILKGALVGLESDG